jgi:multidrug resistance efflux pump
MIRKLMQLRYRRAIVAAAVILIGGLAAFGLLHHSRSQPSIPTFQVSSGEFLDVLEFRGELKAMKSVTIVAPANAGDLQILKIAPDGSAVNEGEDVVEFDASKTQQTLAENQSLLKSAQKEIDQALAQNRLTEEADTTSVMKARYDLEVARLDASKGEIVSTIEGEEAKLKVGDAEQALREAETKLKSDRAQDEATIEDKKQASKKAAYDAQRTEQALASMALKAPSRGTISLVSVWHNGASGPFKAGERAWSGAPIAELPDATSLQVAARVDETERGRLALAQPVTIQLDAIGDRQFTGRVRRIGTIATPDFSGGWPFPRNFDLELSIDQPDQRLRPGMTAQAAVILERIPNAITIPAQASSSSRARRLPTSGTNRGSKRGRFRSNAGAAIACWFRAGCAQAKLWLSKIRR